MELSCGFLYISCIGSAVRLFSDLDIFIKTLMQVEKAPRWLWEKRNTIRVVHWPQNIVCDVLLATRALVSLAFWVIHLSATDIYHAVEDKTAHRIRDSGSGDCY